MSGPPLEPPPQPPIIQAARVGDASQVRLLIAAGADIDERYEFSDAHLPQSGGVSGRTALGVAVYAGHAAVVHVLVQSGANRDIVDDAGRRRDSNTAQCARERQFHGRVVDDEEANRAECRDAHDAARPAAGKAADAVRHARRRSGG